MRGLRAVESKEVDMKNIHQNTIIEELKTKASLLLKASRSKDSAIAAQAAKRLETHSEFPQETWKLKDALRVIANEYGCESWQELKNFAESPFKNHMSAGQLNHWFGDYEEAKEFLELNGGYLLPYQKDYFICSRYFIEGVGINPDDPNWKEIGFDWVVPQNSRALFKLFEQLARLQKQ